MQPQQLAEYYLSFFNTTGYDSGSDDDDLIRSVSHPIQEAPTELRLMIRDLMRIAGQATMQYIYDSLFEIAKTDDMSTVGMNLKGTKKLIFAHVIIRIQGECDRVEANQIRRGFSR